MSVAAACDDAKDETMVQPSAGAGGGAGEAGSGGSAGQGGSGGGAVPNDRDSGSDATPDATTEDPCVNGTLQEYCSLYSCPAFADAAANLSQLTPAIRAEVIVQRPCTAPDGSPRVSVSAYGNALMTRTFIYTADTLELVSYEVIDDLGACSGSAKFGEEGFGEDSGFFGEALPDCSSGYPSFDVFDARAACDALDAGSDDAGDAGADAGTRVCILTQ